MKRKIVIHNHLPARDLGPGSRGRVGFSQATYLNQLNAARQRAQQSSGNKSPAPKDPKKEEKARKREVEGRDAEELTSIRLGPKERGVKIPPPKGPKERAAWEAAVRKREAEGRGKYVGDDSGSIEVRQSDYDKIQIGKTYSFGGRKGRVTGKNSDKGKLATGRASGGNPLVQVTWLDSSK